MSFPGGRINHINPILPVTDLADSIDFYTRKLGLDLHHTFGEPADFAIVGRDGQQIYLSQRAQVQAGTSLAVFVSDPHILREHLVASGVRVFEPDGVGAGEYQVADPDGHVLRLFS